MGGAVPKTLQSPGLPAPEGSCYPSLWVTVPVCPRPRVPFICKDLSTHLSCWRADFLPPHAHCTPERFLEPLPPCMTTDCWLSPSLLGDCVPLQSEDNCFVPVSPAHHPMPVTGQVLCKHLVNLQFGVTIDRSEISFYLLVFAFPFHAQVSTFPPLHLFTTDKFSSLSKKLVFTHRDCFVYWVFIMPNHFRLINVLCFYFITAFLRQQA